MLPRNLFYDMFDEINIKGMNSDVYLKDDTYHIEIDVPGFTCLVFVISVVLLLS